MSSLVTPIYAEVSPVVQLEPGSMTLFEASPQEHFALAKHLTAEVKTEEFVAGRGVLVKWERLRRQNHWFDAIYNACAAGHLTGVRLVPDPPPPPPEPRRPPPDDAAWPAIDFARWREIQERYRMGGK